MWARPESQSAPLGLFALVTNQVKNKTPNGTAVLPSKHCSTASTLRSGWLAFDSSGGDQIATKTPFERQFVICIFLVLLM